MNGADASAPVGKSNSESDRVDGVQATMPRQFDLCTGRRFLGLRVQQRGVELAPGVHAFWEEYTKAPAYMWIQGAILGEQRRQPRDRGPDMYNVRVAVRQRAAVAEHPPYTSTARLLLEAPPVHREEVADDLGPALLDLALQRPPRFHIPKILPEALSLIHI